jgi:methylmalonyl-CoA/ethylmalonyl-CoA epimerase
LIKRVFLVSPRKRCQLGDSRRSLSGRVLDRYVRRSLPDIAQGDLMAKLRHIALIVPDPEKAAKFFEDAFDMKIAGKARRGVYVSDGVMNVALLKQEGDEKVGIYHFGMWVDDLDAAEKKVVDAGGSYLAGRPTSAQSYYEAKYQDPLGIVFDLTHTGWVGAVKDVVAQK